MESAGSSKGKFLPSDVPRNHVQKLILNITAAIMWQQKNECTTAPPHHPGPGCRGEPIFQTLPALRQHSYTIPSKNRIRGVVLLQGKGMWVKRGFWCFWLRIKTISTPQVSPRPDNIATGWDLRNRLASCCSKKSSFTARENKLLRKFLRCHCTNKIQPANNRFLSHTSFACSTRRHILQALSIMGLGYENFHEHILNFSLKEPGTSSWHLHSCLLKTLNTDTEHWTKPRKESKMQLKQQ